MLIIVACLLSLVLAKVISAVIKARRFRWVGLAPA